jgi:poly-gamma-glutamate synthesis protein (capsule biosynthesis protein)
VLVASCHWGLGKDVLQYMTEIAHAAVDAGADIVVGHGPHYSLPIEVYKGKPIFYGSATFRSTLAMAAESTAIGSARWCGRA